MEKLLHTPMKPTTPFNSSIYSDTGLRLKMPAFKIVYGGNSTFTNSFFIHKFISPYFHQWKSSSTLPSKPTTPLNSSTYSDKGLRLKTSAF